MRIQKIFIDSEGKEKLYSILLTENELTTLQERYYTKFNTFIKPENILSRNHNRFDGADAASLREYLLEGHAIPMSSFLDQSGETTNVIHDYILHNANLLDEKKIGVGELMKRSKRAHKALFGIPRRAIRDRINTIKTLAWLKKRSDMDPNEIGYARLPMNTF